MADRHWGAGSTAVAVQATVVQAREGMLHGGWGLPLLGGRAGSRSRFRARRRDSGLIPLRQPLLRADKFCDGTHLLRVQWTSQILAPGRHSASAPGYHLFKPAPEAINVSLRIQRRDLNAIPLGAMAGGALLLEELSAVIY